MDFPDLTRSSNGSEYRSTSRLPTWDQVIRTPGGLGQSILLASIRIGDKDIAMPGIFRGVIHQPVAIGRPGKSELSSQIGVGQIHQAAAIRLDRV